MRGTTRWRLQPCSVAKLDADGGDKTRVGGPHNDDDSQGAEDGQLPLTVMQG